MKILIFGKTRSANRLPEDAADDLRIEGHDIFLFPFRNSKLKKTLEPWLLSPRLGVPLAAMLTRAVRRFAPDMIMAFGPFHWLPPAIFEHIAAVPGRPPMIAWIGDTFGAEAAPSANLFDIVAYTDSGTRALHDRFGFRSTAAFVPLGASRRVRAPGETVPERIPRPVFVGSATPGRRALLSQLREPVSLIGPDWRRGDGPGPHHRDARRIGTTELATVYRAHSSVLNMRNEENALAGLNQRHFAPCVEATPILTDPQPDLAFCFDPDSEILVYRDAGELDGLVAELRADPARAQAVGLAGQRRVLAHHTYSHRVAAMAKLVGVGF